MPSAYTTATDKRNNLLHVLTKRNKPPQGRVAFCCHSGTLSAFLVTSRYASATLKAENTITWCFFARFCERLRCNARRVFNVPRHCGGSHALARARLSALPLALWRACPSFCKGRARSAVALPPLQTLPHALMSRASPTPRKTARMLRFGGALANARFARRWLGNGRVHAPHRKCSATAVAVGNTTKHTIMQA